MDRKIKFRGFKTLTKQVVYGSPICDEQGKVVAICQQMANPVNLGEITGWVFGVENAGQFTGLKDKNGKEIYEGDIIGGYPHGTVQVKWSDEWGCWEAYDEVRYLDDEGKYVLHKNGTLLSNELINCRDTWQVIGNIYENPELLNQIKT